MITFTATVEDCRPEGERFAVELDRTAFYPEGGGQPGDRGVLGDASVVHTAKGEESPIHYIDSPLEPGTDVIGRVDWDRRFDYMQQHTGQHILSAVMLSGGDWPTLSVHQGEEYVSIELDAKEISDTELSRVEREANRVISSNFPVETLWTTAEEIGNYPLRRPPKVSGSIRLVQIPGIDCVPCGGIHTSTTGEVGLVLYLGQEKIRGRVRTFWKIGERAFGHARLNQEILSALGARYSVPAEELPGRLEILERGLYETQGEVNRLKGEILEQRLEDLRKRIDREGVLTAVLDGEDKPFLRNAAQSLMDEGACRFLALVNRRGEELQWIIGAREDSGFDFSPFKAEVLPLIKGKGGGRGPLWQGKGEDPAGLEGFIKAFRESCGS